MKIKVSKFHAIAAAALLCAAVQPAFADAYGYAYGQQPVSAYPGLPAGTLKYLGGPMGVKNVVDQFYTIALGDNRINTILDGSSPELRTAQKAALVQTLLGTPSVAAGTQSSGIQELTTTQYNALVEDLYQAMDNARVSYHVANNVMGSISAYTPALVSAYLMAAPSADQQGVVKVGAPKVE